MKTLENERERREVLDRLSRLQVDSERRWGRMTAHQMICHLIDSLRAALGEKHISQNSSVFKRTIYKWGALWVPLRWPHDIKTHPEIDQQMGGTQPGRIRQRHGDVSHTVPSLLRLGGQICTTWQDGATVKN